MLQYVNHRFHSKGVSFQIPDGYFLNSEPGEEKDDMLYLYAPDKSFHVMMQIEEDCDGSADELETVLDDMAATVVYPISPVAVNGLSGHHTTYRTKRTQYYEVWFDISVGVALSIVIETYGDIMDIDTAAVIAAIDPRPDSK